MKKQNEGIFYLSLKSKQELLHALEKLKKSDLRILDVFSPVPVEEASSYIWKKGTRLPQIGFFGGLLGGIGGFLIQYAIADIYPVQIGGKPQFSYISFFPVIFECMIMGAFLAMVAAFLIRTGLGFGSRRPVLFQKATDNEYIIWLSHNNTHAFKLSEYVSEILEREIQTIEI